MRHDLERIELVPLYADLGKLKEKQKHYEAEQKHRLTPEEEKDKLLKQFKMDNERCVLPGFWKSNFWVIACNEWTVKCNLLRTV